MDEPLTMTRLFAILRRFWLLIALVTIAAAAAALLLTQTMDKTFTATSTLLVKASPGKGATANYEGAQYATNRAKSYPNLLYSTTVLDPVRTELGSTESLADLREDLTASNPEETALVEVTATATTARDAQRKADSAGRHLGDYIAQIESVPGQSPITVETAVYAAAPESPTSPQVPLFVAVGAFAGFALGLLAALALSHRRARSAERRKARQPAAGWWDGTSTTHEATRPGAGPVDGAPARPASPASPGTVNGGHLGVRTPSPAPAARVLGDRGADTAVTPRGRSGSRVSRG